MSRIVTFGEVMMRLTPAGDNLLVQATSFDAHFGGSEFNVAAGAVSLGHDAMCVTRLPDNPLGLRALREMRASGVETPDDILTSEGRLGVYFMETGSSPRPNRVVYDRTGSSIAVYDSDGYRWDDYLEGADWFHVSGITPALGPAPYKATNDAIDAAAGKGIPISFDVNFRAKLWSADDARKLLYPMIRKCRMVVSTEEDLDRVFGIKEDTFEALAGKARGEFGVECVAITLREVKSVRRNMWGGCAIGPDGWMEGRMYDVEIIDRVGAGDSFTAGMIVGFMEKDIGYAVNLAAAFSALKQTVPGDICPVGRTQVEELMEKGSAGRIQR